MAKTNENPVFAGRIFEVLEIRKRGRVTHQSIKTKDSAAILAITDEGKAILVRQHRQAVGQELLELPAGRIEPGETPAAGGLRELMEETGYIVDPDSVVELLKFYPSPGLLTESITIFLARNVKKRQNQGLDEDERIAVEEIPLNELSLMVKKKEILDGKTLLAVAFLNL